VLELKEPAGQAGRVGGAVEIALVAGLDPVCLGFGAGEDQGGHTGMIQLRQGGAPAGGAGAVERSAQDVVVDGLQEGGVVLGGAQDHATPNWTTNPAWPWPVGAHSTWPAARATARRPMGGSGECLFTSL